MKPLLSSIAGLAWIVASSACAYHSPNEPTPVAVTPSAAPASIQLTTSSRPDYQTTVVATVYTADKHGVAHIPIAFATDAGTITSPATTTTDAAGSASAVVSTPTTTTVHVTIGLLSAAIDIAGAVPPGGLAGRPPSLPPDPPAPGVPVVTLNVAPNGFTGVPLLFGVSGSAGQTWSWTFGDGSVVQTAAYTIAHTYGSSGLYPVTVSSPGTRTATATIAISDPPPSSSGATTLAATIACTPGAHGTSTSCNLAGVTYGGLTIPSAAVTTVAWDFGDGGLLTGLFVTHAYTNAGTYTVVATVTATTIDGAKTATTTKTILVP